MKKQRQIIRRMGFVRDQEGIINRYMRESSQWSFHLEKTRRFITSSFTHIQAETVAVLGSGWLLDVPLDHLIRRFKHIYLVDINHPVQIRKRTAAMSQVELIEEDLTGGAVEQIWMHARKHRNLINPGQLSQQLSMKPPLTSIRPDVFISVNLLNQLDIFLCDYLGRLGRFHPDALSPLRTAIQTFHLDWISKNPGCLVTDTLEEVETKKGNLSSRTLLHADLPAGIRNDSWWWNFDTQGTYHHGSRTRMEVHAVEWA